MLCLQISKFGKSRILKYWNRSGKRRGPQNDEEPSKKTWKSWILEHYLPGNTECKIGNKTKLRNQETHKRLFFR